ncbi:MAG: rRNA maturation RNase YbeY [Senegalia sp. (in: firmicutes)]|uniref:rRNA maturation RNase YbeY n=1 Tax=Senegalia sp. (in: firmicutes) TaxID=1924098 RepID=UPI003F94C7A7
MEVYIDNRQTKILLDENIKTIVENVIKECLEYEDFGFNYEISVSFVDNTEIKELNKRFRAKDIETDVLSFPMEDELEGENYIPILGDIIISAEEASIQAKEFGHGLEREIAYLTAHSMFHLMGYDHLNEEEKLLMRKKEKDVMKKLKIFKQ